MTIKSKKGYVCLTECPIDQLDRFQYRGKKADVAIGFPRRNLENRGLFQPLYLKHSTPSIREQFKNAPKGYVEMDDDLGAFNEVRVPGEIPLKEAVWILCSKRNEETKLVDDPRVAYVCSELGMARSFWSQDHQREIIQENNYRRVTFSETGELTSVQTCGEFYYRILTGFALTASVEFPTGKPFELSFPTYENSEGWEGPFTSCQMAMFYYRQIVRYFPQKLEELGNRIDLLWKV